METFFKELDEGDLYLFHEAVEIYYSRLCDNLERHTQEGFALYNEKTHEKTFNWFNALTKKRKRAAYIRDCIQKEIDLRNEKEGGGDWVAM